MIVIALVGGWMISGCRNVAQNVSVLASTDETATIEAPTSTATRTLTPYPTATHTLPPPPTLIVQKPPATRVPVDCQDDLAWVIDLGLAPGPEGTLPVLPSGSQIEGGWRVRNTGTCTWDSAYALVPVQEDAAWALTSQPVVVSGNIKPGGLYDFRVELVAPLTPGTYEAIWKLQNGRGEGVGTPLGLRFEIAALPTETALPEAYLIASPLQVLPGEEARISWSTRQAKAAYFYPSGRAWQEHPVEVSGSTIVKPERTTTYELRLVMGDDSVEIRRITIEVVSFDPPKIQAFGFKPDKVIDRSQCVDIIWRINGRVSTVTVLRDGVYYWESRDEVGDIWDCPTQSGFYTYTLKVAGPGGVVEADRVLQVR